VTRAVSEPFLHGSGGFPRPFWFQFKLSSTMPKKGKKGKGKKGKKAKAEEVPEVTEWDNKSLEEMEEDRKALQEAIVDARMKRNYFEQERVRFFCFLLSFFDFGFQLLAVIRT